MGSRGYLDLFVKQVENPAEEPVLTALTETEGLNQESPNHWSYDEFSHYSFDEFMDRLIAAVPSASFQCTLGPDYSGTASTVIYTPTLGRFQSAANEDGEPVFTTAEVLKAIVDAAGDEDALGITLGVPWLKATS